MNKKLFKNEDFNSVLDMLEHESYFQYKPYKSIKDWAKNEFVAMTSIGEAIAWALNVLSENLVLLDNNGTATLSQFVYDFIDEVQLAKYGIFIKDWNIYHFPSVDTSELLFKIKCNGKEAKCRRISAEEILSCLIDEPLVYI